MFNSSKRVVDSDYVTRTEGNAHRTAVERSIDSLRQEGADALHSLRTEGERELQRVNTELRALGDRVTALETLADQLKRGAAPAQAVSSATAPVAPDGAQAPRVDYGAVAFGLSQIKRDVTNVLGTEVRSADLAAHYRQTVQYFADVFAKSDPAFNEAEFKRQAGV